MLMELQEVTCELWKEAKKKCCKVLNKRDLNKHVYICSRKTYLNEHGLRKYGNMIILYFICPPLYWLVEWLFGWYDCWSTCYIKKMTLNK